MKVSAMERGWNGPLAYVLFTLTVTSIAHSCGKCNAGREDTLFLGASLRENQKLISKNGTFELGFFSPDGNNNWYIGIWYGKIAEKTIVWVANREKPAKKSPGVLKLSRQGNLGVFNADQIVLLWSANISNKASWAVLLDSGNLIMVSNENKSNKIVWQSFDHPVDTWLPGMKLGGKKELACWKNSLDPSPGLFPKGMDPSGIRQFVLIWNNSVQYWESGVWDGQGFSRIPEMKLNSFFSYSVENTTSGFSISYSWTPAANVLTRFVLQKSGVLQLYALYDNANWSVVWSRPTDECRVYGICGAFGSCNSNNVQFCSCVEGFIPRDNRAWNSQDWPSSGCVRQSPLNCYSNNGSSDRFVGYNARLPFDQAFSFPATSNEGCEKACLQNCSCTAFTFIPPSGPCQMWSGDLLNMRTSPSKSNSDVFIRLAASATTMFGHQKSSLGRKTMVSVMGAVLGSLTICLCLFAFSMWRRHRLQYLEEMGIDSSNSFLRVFSYKELKIATRNFDSQLGSGAFGSVFKGTLTDGTLVAVKKLADDSREDQKQFRAEISSLGTIQHVNLVRLRGFCVKGSQRFLVYDCMPNGSLNSLLFRSNSQIKQKVLDWRTRFQIALGTARALFYLHEECRECIIHNDVKPENILLDNEFSPKLADFGMAKLVGRDFSRVLTTMRGTRGYLAPEWLSGLPITPKVDVYSYGRTLLEIISGRRNLDMSVLDSKKRYFPSWAAAQFYQGINIKNIVEEGVELAEEGVIEEARRAVVVGLLCIEEDENVRPTMGQVLRMLEGKMELPTPQIPSDSDCDVIA